MTTIKKYFCLFLFFSVLPGGIFAQGNDFGLWGGLTGTYSLDKHLEAKLNASVRTIDNVSGIDQYFGELGLGYELNDYVSFEGSLRLINKNEDDSAFHFRHKLYLSVKGTLPAGRFEFSARLMYQKTRKTYIEDNNDMLPEHYARLKLKSSYSSPASPLKPFVSFEPFVPVNNGKGFEIKKSRYSAGVDLKFSIHSSVEAAYIYERFTKSGATNMHILSLNYELAF